MKQNTQFNYDVFLSHNSKDKEIVRVMAKKLQDYGLKIWFDEWCIKPGDDIYLKVEKGLEESKILVLCLSPNAINSDWVKLERSTVLFRDPINSNRRFIPVLIEDCDLPDTLKRYRYVDYRSAVDSSLKELLAACGQGDDAEDLLWSNNKSDDSILPKEVEEKIKEAQEANRKGKYELSKEIWNKIGETAHETKNQKLSIRVRLELAYIEASEGSNDLDNALKIANECLIESKKTNLGNQVVRILQLLGEVHRFKGNTDKARGFLNAALEYSKSTNDQCSEGWAWIALAMLSNQNKEAFEVQFNYTKEAYDTFTKLLVSGKEDASVEANAGYGFCHLVRAKIYGYRKHEEALTEYSRAISIYREMGESWEYDLGRLLLERGEMQAMHDDLKLGVQDIISASEIFIKLEDQYMTAKCFLACGELLDKQGHRKEAEKYYKSAIQTAAPIKDERKKSWFFFRYAMKLLELGEHDKAKKILLMLLSSESTKDSQKLDVLKTLSDIAKVTQNEKELKEYEQYSLSIIDNLLSEAQSPKERLRLLYNKGHTLHGLKKYEIALETFQRAIRLAESMPAKSKLPDIWAAIAEVHHKMKNPKEERLAYEQVLKLCEDDKSSPQLVTTLTMIAQMELKESNFNEARKLLDKAELLCKKIMPFMMFVINDIRQRLKEAESKANDTNETKK